MKINEKTPPSMLDKIKPVHTKGSEFTKTKAAALCAFSVIPK